MAGQISSVFSYDSAARKARRDAAYAEFRKHVNACLLDAPIAEDVTSVARCIAESGITYELLHDCIIRGDRDARAEAVIRTMPYLKHQVEDIEYYQSIYAMVFDYAFSEWEMHPSRFDAIRERRALVGDIYTTGFAGTPEQANKFVDEVYPHAYSAILRGLQKLTRHSSDDYDPAMAWTLRARPVVKRKVPVEDDIHEILDAKPFFQRCEREVEKVAAELHSGGNAILSFVNGCLRESYDDFDSMYGESLSYDAQVRIEERLHESEDSLALDHSIALLLLESAASHAVETLKACPARNAHKAMNDFSRHFEPSIRMITEIADECMEDPRTLRDFHAALSTFQQQLLKYAHDAAVTRSESNGRVC